MPDKVGAVLVVGAGISGIQSALDLADSGYKVYLLDKSPSIGGTMVQLDKTFPTNDCSMCILAPKLVGAGRHHNIELITNAEVEKVVGEVGNFTVTINKKPRHIIEDKCTGCAECVTECPVAVPNEYNELLNDRKAIYLMFPQAVPRKVSISKRGTPPCKDACPAHTNAQGYVALISMKKYNEALNLIRERCPVPSVIGRICHHPCESSCNRADVDEPINICGLKRFVADHVRENGEEEIELPKEKKNDKVAIVGSGPSGLTVAYRLAKLGHPVTIFEKSSVPGGMLRQGIPDYRLPPEILNADIEHIKKYGVEIKTNSPIGPPGPSINDLLKEYKAVFVGVGLQDSGRLNIEGEDLGSVIFGIDFLKKCNLGSEVKVGKKVLVIGGGNVAVDVGRSALRKGADEVHLIMLESEDIIPAHPWEVEEAKEEGIIFHLSRGPKRFVGKGGKVTGVDTLFCSSVFDSDGKFKPVLDPGTEEVFDGDMVIVSIGQAADLKFLEQDKEIKIGRGIEINENNFQTSIPGVFAGGEIVTGPGSAMEAVATGNKAAFAIEKFLNGEDISNITETIPDFSEEEVVKLDDIEYLDRYPPEPRKNNTITTPDVRKKDFKEFTQGLDEETAISEAKRCLNCGLCSECFECVRVCLAEALDHDQTDETVTVNVGSVILSPGFDEFDPKLKSEYGYGKVRNVLSSIEFERILSATGPFEGHVKRTSDHKQPDTVAFIQCVGSRDSSCGNEFCSSVCCMYSVKEAIIAQEHTPGLKTEIFFMDMRAFGKEFDDYYNRAQDEYGIKFNRCRVASIEQGDNDNVLIHYVEGDEVKTKEFNMAVLAVGFESTRTAQKLC
jgi:heterodisulfide reductase subunit A-like polyferredoxin